MTPITLVGDSHHAHLTDYVLVEQLPIRFKYCSGEFLLEPFAMLNQDGEIEWSKPEVKKKYGAPLKNEGLIGVSLGHVLAVLAIDRMWREVAPWRVSTRVGLQPLSDGLLRHMVLEQCAAALAFMDLLVSARFNAFVIEPPPLKRRHPVIKAGTAPYVLREVDTRWRLIMREEYRKRDMRCIEAPSEAFDADGFIKDEYDFTADHDTHHANTPYAALIVRQILKLQDVT